MMGAMYTSYNAVSGSYSQVSDRAKISNQGRDLVGMIVRDIRNAGFRYFGDNIPVTSAHSPIIITKAKKANASFKLREGMSVGLKVTLRKSKMYEFLDRLINIALPRVRDFRGVSDKSFDGKGNYSLGLKEQFIFPEIEYDTVDTPRGMDITIVTTAKTDDEARELLKNFNFPFVK